MERGIGVLYVRKTDYFVREKNDSQHPTWTITRIFLKTDSTDRISPLGYITQLLCVKSTAYFLFWFFNMPDRVNAMKLMNRTYFYTRWWYIFQCITQSNCEDFFSFCDYWNKGKEGSAAWHNGKNILCRHSE